MRMEQYGLSLHPQKTRLIEFGRFAAQWRARRGMGKPETFNFLGFTHICGRSRGGKFLLQRTTRRDRMRLALSRIGEELRRLRHDPLSKQGAWLRQVVRGYFAYHAVPTNFRRLSAFRYHVMVRWLRTLRRRSQKDSFKWQRMLHLAERWLPRPCILHPWPLERFAVMHPQWEPGARIAPAGICAGDAQ
jgi:hypothetical protein